VGELGVKRPLCCGFFKTEGERVRVNGDVWSINGVVLRWGMLSCADDGREKIMAEE
jgi:hypothetical protein